MKIQNLLTLAIAFAAPLAANASTITVSDFSGTSVANLQQNIVKTSNGNNVATGGAKIRLGFFPTTAVSAVADLVRGTKQEVYSNLLTKFVPLGEGLDGDLGSPGGTGGAAPPRFANRAIFGTQYTGRIAGSVVGVTPAPAATVWDSGNITGVPAGTRIFMLIYNNADPNLATEFGVFSADTWLMPSDNLSNPTFTTVDVNSTTEVFKGSLGSLVLSAFVPEPSTSMMALLAGLGLVARRRR